MNDLFLHLDSHYCSQTPIFISPVLAQFNCDYQDVAKWVESRQNQLTDDEWNFDYLEKKKAQSSDSRSANSSYTSTLKIQSYPKPQLPIVPEKQDIRSQIMSQSIFFSQQRSQQWDGNSNKKTQWKKIHCIRPKDNCREETWALDGDDAVLAVAAALEMRELKKENEIKRKKKEREKKQRHLDKQNEILRKKKETEQREKQVQDFFSQRDSKNANNAGLSQSGNASGHFRSTDLVNFRTGNNQGPLSESSSSSGVEFIDD